MKLRLVVMLVVLLGLGAYFVARHPVWSVKVKEAFDTATLPMPMPDTGSSETVYKWTDAQGRVQYGTDVPKGVRAEPVSGGTVNTLSIPKPPPVAKPAQSDPLEGKSIHELATERAIEQSTR
ncbi:MAG: DUF4124 domain-containing protein [Rhodocyclaceae bacterium]